MVASFRRRHAGVSAAGSQSRTQSEVETCEPGELNFSPREASNYVLSMIAELRAIAIAAEFRFLAYLLEIAFQEAYRLETEFARDGKGKAQESRPTT